MKVKKDDLPLFFNVNAVVQAQMHKHLSIILSEDLKWKEHIDYFLVGPCRRLVCFGDCQINCLEGKKNLFINV